MDSSGNLLFGNLRLATLVGGNSATMYCFGLDAHQHTPRDRVVCPANKANPPSPNPILVMFSLLYGFWQYMWQRDEYYVVILGLDNAGKTTLLEQAKATLNPHAKGVNFAKISCTVGLNIGKIASEGVVLNFWDLGGQSELQCLWDKVSGVDVWVCLFDLMLIFGAVFR